MLLNQLQLVSERLAINIVSIIHNPTHLFSYMAALIYDVACFGKVY